MDEGRLGYLKTIVDDKVRCRLDNKPQFVEICTRCEWFNRFRNNPRLEKALFCKYETEEESKRLASAMDILYGRSSACPECGTDVIDRTIKDGAHKGHGHYYCPKCNKAVIWI